MKIKCCNPKRTKQSGAALLAALIILTIVAFTGVTIAQLTSSTLNDSTYVTDSTYSIVNADAAITHSFERLQNAITNNNFDPNEALSIVSKPDPTLWWVTSDNWKVDAVSKVKQLPTSDEQGKPLYRVEYMGPSTQLQVSNQAKAILQYYRATATASGKIANTEDQKSTAVLQANIVVYHQ